MIAHEKYFCLSDIEQCFNETVDKERIPVCFVPHTNLKRHSQNLLLYGSSFVAPHYQQFKFGLRRID